MYATLDDLMTRLGEPYHDLYISRDGSSLDDQAAADIAAACAEIDGSIAGRYAVPVTAAASAEMLRYWAVTLVEEIAWSRAGKAETPENVRYRVEAVRKKLEAIAAGTMQLPGAATVDTPAASALLVDGDEPLFRRSKIRR